MNFIKTKINQTISLAIFDNELIKEKSEKLFEEIDLSLRKKYEKIMKLLREDYIDPIQELSYEHILNITKNYTYKTVSNKAVKMAFEDQKYDIQENILDIFTDGEVIKDYILNKIILDAFIYTLNNCPSISFYDRIEKIRKVILLAKNLKN